MSAVAAAGPATDVVLQTESLGIHYGDRSALEDVTLGFRTYQTVSLLGPNGAGKSTLLRCLAGMLAPTHGRVRLHGRDVTGPSREVVYVPQRSGVDWSFPTSVLDVTLTGRGLTRPRLRPIPRGDRDDALAALGEVGMRRLAAVQIGALSGGQQQRVFLARALLQNGDVYLLDEPFTGVDVPTQQLLVDLFDRLCRSGKALVYATHDLALAAASSDRVILLNRRVVADGPPPAAMTAFNLKAAFGGQAVIPFAQDAS